MPFKSENPEYLARFLPYLLKNWLILIFNRIIVHHLVKVGLQFFSRWSCFLQQYWLLSRGRWRASFSLQTLGLLKRTLLPPLSVFLNNFRLRTKKVVQVYLAHAPLPPGGKGREVVVVPGGSDRGLVLALGGQLVQELLVNWGEVEAVEDVAQGLLVHHVVVLQVLEQALLQGGALAEQAVDQDWGLRNGDENLASSS